MINRYGGKMNRAEHYAELAFLRAMPDHLLPEVPNGRLKNRLSKLLKLTDLEIQKLKDMTFEECEQTADIIKEFALLSGWDGKKRHVVSVVSFLLAMIEDSKYNYPDSIISVLNDLFDYFERAKAIKGLCLMSGSRAAEKLKDVNNVRKEQT